MHDSDTILVNGALFGRAKAAIPASVLTACFTASIGLKILVSCVDFVHPLLKLKIFIALFRGFELLTAM